jgi:hypothetical protein
VKYLICQFFYQAVYVVWFTHKNDTVMGLVGRGKTIFAMEVRQLFRNIWSLKIDIDIMSLNPYSGNITLKFLRIPSTFMPDNGKS